MAGSRKERLPYQITLRGLLAVTTAFTISLCLFWYAECLESWWAIFAGAAFMGGALGAVIGQVFRDEGGGAASMGAFVGALSVPLALILFVPLVVAILNASQ
jgi:uncharacterized membrane protein